MLWFNGGIPEAIMSSKQRKLPFIVFIEGQDEASTQMSAVWDDSKVTELFSPEKCVAVKLNNESEQCNQFSQLYPVVCVPSVFFIGSTGMPLEVIGGAITSDELIAKADTAFEAFRKEAGNTEPSPPADPVPSASSESQEATSSSTIEERVERAKRLIEDKRQEKLEKEKQEQIQKESKRRDEGQQMNVAKKELEERRQQELVNQIREDRAQERAAREAIRKQIAQDKAEREARRKDDLRDKMSAQPSTSSKTTTTTTTPKTNSTTARLQFRLPDGSSVIETFQADALLEAARQFIESHLESRYNSITLTTVYPRRQLTDEDMKTSLSSLGLAPSSTLIVSPSKSSAVSKASSGSFIMMIFAPFLALFNFIKVFLFGGSEHPRGSYGGDTVHRREGREEVKYADAKKTASPNSDLRRRPTGNQGSTEGNIHRLRNQDDDDDENNTWNGNSTQQL